MFEESDKADEVLFEARKMLAEAGIEMTVGDLAEICEAGLNLSDLVSRPVAVELWDGFGLQFDSAESWVDFLEFSDD